MSSGSRLIPERLEDAINALQEAFWWRETPQGIKYWEEVMQNLESLRPASAQETGRDEPINCFNVYAPTKRCMKLKGHPDPCGPL